MAEEAMVETQCGCGRLNKWRLKEQNTISK